MIQTDKEIELEFKLEYDLKNCANCENFRIKPCLLIDPLRVCSKHEWNKMERIERSYD